MKKHILLVDDDLSFVEPLSQYLSWYDFQVDGETDFKSARARLAQEQFDMIILNALTADNLFQSAFRFAEALRKMERTPAANLPILIVGHDDPTVREWKWLKQLDAFYLNKFEGIEKWIEKICAALHTTCDLLQASQNFPRKGS